MSIRMTKAQMRTLAALEGQLVEPHDDGTGWEFDQWPDGEVRVRDLERDFYIAADGKVQGGWVTS